MRATIVAIAGAASACTYSLDDYAPSDTPSIAAAPDPDAVRDDAGLDDGAPTSSGVHHDAAASDAGDAAADARHTTADAHDDTSNDRADDRSRDADPDDDRSEPDDHDHGRRGNGERDDAGAKGKDR